MSPNRALGTMLVSLSLSFTTAQRTVAQTSPGWSYATNITIDSGDANNRISMAMRQQVTDRYLRLEILQMSGMRQDMSGSEGTYTVFDSADSTATIMMTKQKMASITDMAPMMSAAHPQFQMHLRGTDGSGGYEDLGAGPRLLGHATEHYRSTVHGTAEYQIGEQSCTKPINTVSEVWIAPDVDLMPALSAVMKHFGSGANPVSGANLVSDAGPPMPKGTPLRTIAQSTSTDATGVSRTVTITTEYVEISDAPIDRSAFVAPSDFKVLDMRAAIAKLNARPAGRARLNSATAGASRNLAMTLCQ
jgi:hypothetical protein